MAQHVAQIGALSAWLGTKSRTSLRKWRPESVAGTTPEVPDTSSEDAGVGRMRAASVARSSAPRASHPFGRRFGERCHAHIAGAAGSADGLGDDRHPAAPRGGAPHRHRGLRGGPCWQPRLQSMLMSPTTTQAHLWSIVSRHPSGAAALSQDHIAQVSRGAAGVATQFSRSARPITLGQDLRTCATHDASSLLPGAFLEQSLRAGRHIRSNSAQTRPILAQTEPIWAELCKVGSV